MEIESLTRVIIRDEATGRLFPVSPHELRQRATSDQAAPFMEDEKEVMLAATRARVLMPFALAGKPLHSHELREVQGKLGLRRTQVYAILAKLRKQPVPASIIRRPRGSSKGSKTLDRRIEAIIVSEIRSATRDRRSLFVGTIHTRIAVACSDLGLKGPCVKTVRNRIRTLSHELTLRRRLGKRRAKERTTLFAGKIATTAALDMVEIDHSPLDIILVSTEDRVPIGRAFLTVVVDTHTRVCLGFNLDYEVPQENSVALALVHAVLPKESWLAEHGLSEIEWPMYGLMRGIRTDKGAEFKSAAFIGACRRYGIDAVMRIKKESGAIVERLIGTIQARASQEPGATGSDPRKQRRSPAPSEDAQMTLWEAEQWLAREICNRYHYERHGGIGMPPMKAWRSAFSDATGTHLPQIIGNSRDFMIAFLPEIHRVINHDGIHAFGERYATYELAPFVQPTLKRSIKYNPKAIGKLWVDCGTGSYIEVPFADRRLPNVPLFEHRAARKQSSIENASAFDLISHARAQQTGRMNAKNATRAARNRERLLQCSLRAGADLPDGTVGPSRPISAIQEDESIDYGTPAKISGGGEV